VERVRISELLDRYPHQLSGGQQQRVALARAIVFQPPLLLMDEPLSALDRNLREEMQYELKALHRQLHTTIIFVTHDQGEAPQPCRTTTSGSGSPSGASSRKRRSRPAAGHMIEQPVEHRCS